MRPGLVSNHSPVVVLRAVKLRVAHEAGLVEQTVAAGALETLFVEKEEVLALLLTDQARPVGRPAGAGQAARVELAHAAREELHEIPVADGLAALVTDEQPLALLEVLLLHHWLATLLLAGSCRRIALHFFSVLEAQRRRRGCR